MLAIDVTRMLRGRGLPVTDAFDNCSDMLKAAADLLRCLDVEPHHSPPQPAVEHIPVLVAAATLMRAAGIEPNAVITWPGQPS